MALQFAAQLPRQTHRRAVLLAAAFGLLLILIAHGPLHQSQAYHAFADSRSGFGIPNFLNVVSNIPFFMVGLAGMRQCMSAKHIAMRASWLTLFSSVMLTAFGSSYYHWSPSNATLTWDRLPMALGFVGIMTAVVGEHIGEAYELRVYVPTLAAGLAGIVMGHFADDLRIYAWVQFGSLLVIVLTLALFPARYSHRAHIAGAFGFYALAKLAEASDRPLFALTGQVVSGHSLKHLLAAAAPLVLLNMLIRRSPLPPAIGKLASSDSLRRPTIFSPQELTSC